MEESTFLSAGSWRGKWIVCLSIAMAAAFAMLFPEDALRYERAALADHQLWRLLTAHLVHLGPLHLFLNLAGLVLICELLWLELPVRHGVAVVASSAIAVSLLLWTFQPQVQWYAGLSGLVHALWAACVTALLWRPTAIGRKETRLVAGAGGVLLVIKLTAESAGMLSSGPAAEGFHIITAAHAYGAFSGATYVLLWREIKMLSHRK